MGGVPRALGQPPSLSPENPLRGATGEEAQGHGGSAGHGRPVRTATTPGPQEASSPPGGPLPTKPGPAFPCEPWNSHERERPGRPQRPATCPSGLLPPRPHPRARGGGPSQETGTHRPHWRRPGGRARSSPQAPPPPHPPGRRLQGSLFARGQAAPSRAARPRPSPHGRRWGLEAAPSRFDPLPDRARGAGGAHSQPHPPPPAFLARPLPGALPQPRSLTLGRGPSQQEAQPRRRAESNWPRWLAAPNPGGARLGSRRPPAPDCE